MFMSTPAIHQSSSISTITIVSNLLILIVITNISITFLNVDHNTAPQASPSIPQPIHRHCLSTWSSHMLTGLGPWRQSSRFDHSTTRHRPSHYSNMHIIQMSSMPIEVCVCESTPTAVSTATRQRGQCINVGIYASPPTHTHKHQRISTRAPASTSTHHQQRINTNINAS